MRCPVLPWPAASILNWSAEAEDLRPRSAKDVAWPCIAHEIARQRRGRSIKRFAGRSRGANPSRPLLTAAKKKTGGAKKGILF